jgi:hypothetical protein
MKSRNKESIRRGWDAFLIGPLPIVGAKAANTVRGNESNQFTERAGATRPAQKGYLPFFLLVFLAAFFLAMALLPPFIFLHCKWNPN